MAKKLNTDKIDQAIAGSQKRQLAGLALFVALRDASLASAAGRGHSIDNLVRRKGRGGVYYGTCSRCGADLWLRLDTEAVSGDALAPCKT